MENIMEIVQEMGRSYVVVDDDTTGEYEYMREMLINNSIPGLLCCSRVLYNNRTVLKYDITNKKSLSREYEGRQLSYGEIRILILKLGEILKYGMDYLLEESMYSIDPDWIYKDVETDEIKLLYLPFITVTDPMYEVAGRYYKFNDFLLEKTDHRSEKAVGLAYRFYRMSKEEFFSIESFCYALAREGCEVDSTANEVLKSSDNMDSVCQISEASARQEISYSSFNNNNYSENMSTDGNRYIEDAKKVQPDKSFLVDASYESEEKQASFTLSAIMAVAAVISVAVYVFFLQSNIYGIYVGLAGIVMGISAIIMAGYNLYKYFEEKRLNEYEEADENVTVNDYWYDSNDTQVLEGDATVNFDDNSFDRNMEKIFRWNEDGVAREKVLRDYPVVIGKKYDSVDLCISEPTVSRKHARFTCKGNDIFIQDLGSKNGTYVSGRKLTVGELVKVDNTTQIRFGKVVASVV